MSDRNPPSFDLFGRLRRALGGGAPAPISVDLWAQTLAAHPFLATLPPERQSRLRSLAAQFLATTRFAGAGGMVINEAVGVAIAAQACLPVLELGLGCYGAALEIVVYPDQFLVPRREVDELGLVHEEEAWLAGEASATGPIILSWADVADSSAPDGGHTSAKVVIHEFVHRLDLADGLADGIPPLPRERRRHWEVALAEAFEGFSRQLEDVERAIPPAVDPDSPEADPWYALLPLDPYAAQDPAEFFAVSGEAFFTDPSALHAAFPTWHDCLRDFFAGPPRTRD